MGSLTSLPKEEKWLLGAGCGLRILFFFFSQGNGGDAFARASVTANWLQHPSLSLDFGGPKWPPLHFWLMALVAQVVPDVLLACRLLSLAAGLISLWLFWRLVVLLYGETAGLLSLTVFVFYSLHIAYATASSSEETFLVFVLGGLLGVFSFRTSRNYGHLIAGGLSLTAAAAIRFEAWILIFTLGVLFLLGKKGQRFPSSEYWKALVAFGISSGLWPIFWTIRSWILSGHPFYALSTNRASVPDQLATFPEHQMFYEIALSPGVILLTLTPVAIAGTLYGLWLSFRERRSIDFALLAVCFGVFQMATIATHGLVALARYTLTPGTFCALLAGYGLAELSKLFRVRRNIVLVTVTTVVVVNLALIVGLSQRSSHLADKFRSISPLMQFPVRIERVGKFLRQHMHPEDRLVIDNYNDEPNLLAAAIGIPLLADDRVFMSPSERYTPPFQFMILYHPRFAIMSQRGTIGSRLGLPATCWESWIVDGADLRCLYENEIYRVFEIRYGDLSGSRLSENARIGISRR